MAALLIIFIVLPLALMGGLLLAAWKFCDDLQLRLVSSVFVLICGGLLINDALLPPAMGNDAAYAALGLVTLSVVGAMSAIVLLASFHRRKS